MNVMAEETQGRVYPQFSEKQIRAYFMAEENRKRAIQRIVTIMLISLGVLAVFWLLNLLSGSVHTALIILIGVLTLLLGAGSIAFVIKKIIPPFTDQEYDVWLESTVQGRLVKALEGIGIDESSDIDPILHVHGFILPGTKDANKYRPEDILFKKCKDGKYRFSINIFTYFHPTEHQLAVFVFDINAVNHSDRREATKEYFYQDIVGATVEDDHDMVKINSEAYPYRAQSFALRICDGYSISATFRSLPVDNRQDLPIYDIPDSDLADNTIKRLRKLLRDKKRGPSA
jgi:hypothetical protein